MQNVGRRVRVVASAEAAVASDMSLEERKEIFETVVGIETHVQVLQSSPKASCTYDSFEASSNTEVLLTAAEHEDKGIL